jgi:phage repressor protein C with HTH and peptisase S24 domain
MMLGEMNSRTLISTPLSEWLVEALVQSGLSQTALAERLDARVPKKIDRSIINKMTLGKRVISAEEMLLISEITGVDLPREKLDAPSVSVAGRVGAGAKVPVFDAYEKGGGPQVECPPGLSPHGIVAVEVEGDSMEPIYSSGDLLFYTRDTHEGVPDDVIGHRCICEDDNGMGWVKQVKRGSEPGLYNLVSLNPGADNMHDVRLTWAARVRLHWPADLVKRV